MHIKYCGCIFTYDLRGERGGVRKNSCGRYCTNILPNRYINDLLQQYELQFSALSSVRKRFAKTVKKKNTGWDLGSCSSNKFPSFQR